MLDRQELGDHLLFFSTCPAGIDLNHLAFISTSEEPFGFDHLQQLARVSGISCNHEEKRFDERPRCFSCIGLQLYLYALVQPHAVFQLQLFNLVGRHSRGIEVLPRYNGGLFYKTVCHCPAQRVFINDILEWHRTAAGLDKRSRGQLQTKYGSQFIDRPHTCWGSITVRLIH